MNWLQEIEFADLLDKDMALVYQECGHETLIILWEKMSGLNIYVSEKSLFAAKQRYIRKVHGKCLAENTLFDKKALAVLLKVSERFVEKAIAMTEVKDDRQMSLI